MKHGRLIIAALVGAMLITSLAGCGSKGTNDGESGEYQKINLSMAVNGTDTQIDSLVAHHFADLVSERSGGNIVIDVFSNDTLAGGNSTKGVEYIAVGGSDLGAYATCVLANLERSSRSRRCRGRLRPISRRARSLIPPAASITLRCWRTRESRTLARSTTASVS